MLILARTSACLLLLCLIFLPAVEAWADDFIIKFSAKLDRTLVPAGEALIAPLADGATVTGQLVLSDDALRDTKPAAGTTSTVWLKSVKQITLEGAIAASFVGGNVFVQDGQFQVSAVKQYCTNCKADGPAMTARAGERTVTYRPARYFFMQSAPHKGKNAVLAKTLRNAAKLSRSAPVRAMIFFADSMSGVERLRFILVLDPFDITIRTSN